jgi:glycosyltransferase involved in cell wall biosynthesis
MKSVCIFPPIENLSQLCDVASRIAWHFAHVDNVQFVLPVANDQIGLNQLAVPAGFDSSISQFLPKVVERTRVVRVKEPSEALPLLDDADVILKRVQDDPWIEQALKTKTRKGKIYRVDPERVRQEGSFYIEAALSLSSDKERMVHESRERFLRFKTAIGKFKRSWVLATGPSIEAFKELDFNDTLAIACNSTILNKDLMARSKPKILVFADPIFHFGVSQYAGAFRDAVRTAMEATDITMVVPFKYYPLLTGMMPEYRDRIIGIPFCKKAYFNLDIGSDFELKVTSNILTLLLLPIASTFSDEIHLIGCDGRPLDKDNYFWGHGKSVQINSKMQNIKEVHPGFFDIDYNEYYFEHCHTLENLIEQGESVGKHYYHHGNSYIPALKSRIWEDPDRGSSLDASERTQSDLCVLLEPDGMGTSGHYVPWHNHLLEELRSKRLPTFVLCNQNQSASLYSEEALAVIKPRSWAVSRSAFSFKRDFTDSPTYQNFRNDTLSGLASLCDLHGARKISLFMYYGSVQILKALQEIRKSMRGKGVDVKVTLCLFHESVILDDQHKEPRFPPNAKEILMEAAAQTSDYRVLAVTDELGAVVYDRFGVKIRTLPNPIPSAPGSLRSEIRKSNEDQQSTRNFIDKDKFSVIFPCRLRPEKGGAITREYVHALGNAYIASQAKVMVRSMLDDTGYDPSTVTIIGDDVSEEEYWRHMRESQIVVIPYTAPHFKYRTSGIIVDALFAGKPCIVIEGTWLASVIRKLGAGLPVRYYGPESIASAISVMRKNYSFFLTNAANAYAKYSELNSWNALSRTVFD